MHVLRFLSLALLLCAACTSPSPAADAVPADVVFTHATFTTLDEAVPEAQALAVLDGRILALGSVDAILSNCVVNLSPDKAAVYADAFRVLKPGGRLAIRDVVLTAPVPDELAQSVAALVGCAAGAAQASEVVEILKGAGFTDIRVDVDEKSRTMIDEWLPDMGAGDVAASAEIRARKPEAV